MPDGSPAARRVQHRGRAHDDKESRSVYDSDNQVGFGGRAKILPGKSLTFKIGYGYTPGQDFNLIVTGYNEKYDKRSEAIYSDKIT